MVLMVMGIDSAAKTPIMATTTRSSRIVKPAGEG
jgi:hypothetical protein